MSTNVKIAIAAAGLVLAAAGGIAAWCIMANTQHIDPVAKIYQNSELVKIIPLSEDTEFTVKCNDGYNVITVHNGKISVSEADCPDKVCISTGEISGGLPIVCLPHRLEILVTNGENKTDADI